MKRQIFVGLLVAAGLAALAMVPDCDKDHPGHDCVPIRLPGLGEDWCGGPTGQPTPTIGFWKTLTGQFSYNSQADECLPEYDLPHAVDPITVIARLHYHPFLPDRYDLVPGEEESWERAAYHVDHHGWNETTNRGQYFRQSGDCAEGSISLADSTAPFGAERWHARDQQVTGVQDPYHGRLPGEASGATVTPFTPHYDESVTDLVPPYDACSVIGHYVEEDYDPSPQMVWSGFDRGREELVIRWLNDPDGHHEMVESQFWGRPTPMQQCNGDLSSTNGYVYHIALCLAAYPCG